MSREKQETSGRPAPSGGASLGRSAEGFFYGDRALSGESLNIRVWELRICSGTPRRNAEQPCRFLEPRREASRRPFSGKGGRVRQAQACGGFPEATQVSDFKRFSLLRPTRCSVKETLDVGVLTLPPVLQAAQSSLHNASFQI